MVATLCRCCRGQALSAETSTDGPVPAAVLKGVEAGGHAGDAFVELGVECWDGWCRLGWSGGGAGWFGGFGYAGLLVEALADGEGRFAVGGSGDDLGEAFCRVDGAGGVDDDGVVGFSAAGHGDVGVVAAGAGFEDGDADVDGVALVSVSGDGPSELDVAGDVVGWEP